MKHWKVLSSQVVLAAVLGVGMTGLGTKVEAAENTIPIQMLGLNDFHGAIDATSTAFIEDEKYEDVGRVANLAVHLNEAEAEFKKGNDKAETVRLQAGDMVGASPANSALLQDEPTVRAFDAMNFTIGTLGNHEFDEGLKEFKRIIDGKAPVREDFGENMDDKLWDVVANYPREASKQEIVVANIENKTDGDHGKKGEIPYGFKPYTIKTYGEGDEAVKVAYLGIVTSEFPNLVLAQHTQDYKVLDEAETMAKYSKELREKEGVNAIVVVSHIAATSNKGEVQGEIVDIMSNVDKLDPENSIDVVFAGHNHQFTNGVIKGKNEVRIVQSTSQGKAYIDLRGELDPETKDFAKTPEAEIKPTTDVGEEKQDKDVQAIVTEANDLIKPITEAKVVSADTETLTKDAEGRQVITKDYNAHSESPLGNLITDAQLYMANNEELKDENGKVVKADFALTNNGGIRADLIADKEGNFTWGAIQTVQPFGNILQVVEISGKDLRSALNEQHKNGKLHYFLQISGLNYTYSGVGDDFEVIDITDKDGHAIKDDKNYNIIINDFLFGGGDGFKSFTKGKLLTAMDTDTSIFVNYFKKLEADGEKVKAPEVGRKVEVKADKKDKAKDEKEATSETKEEQDSEVKKDIKSNKGIIGAVAVVIIGAIVYFMQKGKKE